MNARISTVLFNGEPLKIARDPRISEYAQQTIDHLELLLANSRSRVRQLESANNYLDKDLSAAEKRIKTLEQQLGIE